MLNGSKAISFDKLSLKLFIALILKPSLFILYVIDISKGCILLFPCNAQIINTGILFDGKESNNLLTKLNDELAYYIVKI